MKLRKDRYDKRWYLDFNKNAFMHFINDWRQIFGNWNWYAFHVVHIYIENDIVCPGYEFEFVVLGFGFRLRINKKSFKDSELNQIYKDVKKEIKEGRKFRSFRMLLREPTEDKK